jgi:flagellar hook-associated protein 3 FlgL
MTIDRVSNSGQAQALLAQLMQAQTALSNSQNQVTTGKVSTDYSGYGNKTEMLEAARTAAARSDSYQANTALAVNQVNLQDTQLSQLSSLADDLRQAMTKAVANNDATGLVTEAQNVFDQASQILNSQDANGNYIYGGVNDNTPPVTVSTFSGLTSIPSASAAFANSSQAKSVLVADGETVKVGVLASDVATNLMQTLKSIADFNAGPSGNLGTGMNGTQSNFLSGEISSAANAVQTVNTASAANGDTYKRLNDAVTQQQSLSTMYKGFVSDIENVDMGQAITNLNLNQTALQAALQVTAQLSKVSLLNFLPAA